jgi:hypothetical protein
MDILLIGLGLIGLTLLGLRLIFGSRAKQAGQTGAWTLPSGVTLEPKPLMSEKELALYNLLQMAVRDHYLVFAQVPLWRLLHVEAEDRSRFQVLRKLALKCADFALVHAGSRKVEQIIRLDDESEPEPAAGTAQRGWQEVVEAAGIRMTMLNPKATYTVQQLAAIVGVDDPG